LKIFDSRSELIPYLKMYGQGSTIGFVPTMGALHEGHLSLIEIAKQQSDRVVSSIFVNPKQFNDSADFVNYPTSLDKDLEMLLDADTDVVYVPSVSDIYPENYIQPMPLDLEGLDKTMEGKYRPGHFDGVVQVVDILLQIVQPQKLFLGMKDFQQIMVIKRIVAQRHPSVEIIPCPTLREEDGLAMSSRNRRLTPTQRLRANEVYNALLSVKKCYPIVSPENAINMATQNLNEIDGFSVDYVEIVDFDTMQPIKQWQKSGSQVACIAVKLGSIRLIDNLII
jgi:pantoate--beta-alanine ligase